MSSTPLPPYFRINPDQALENLDSPITTKGFATIAAAARYGRDDLAGRGLANDSKRYLRLFSTWEITHYLIPVAQAHFRRVLKQNPDLPQGQSDTKGGAKWFSLDEVLTLRAYFSSQGSKAKEYLPYRPRGLPAKIVAVANFKSGVGKTSTASHLAMSAALDGYRVLVIDLDSQASITSVFGGTVSDEWGTIFPLLARHYIKHLQSDNQRRMDRGDNPIPLDETLTKALGITTQSLIQPTHWPNVDLIGAQLNLYRAEFQVPAWRLQGRGWNLWDALTDTLGADGVLDSYDVVFIDTPPALGYLTISGLAAADILLVPVGASFLEFDSTGRFFDMLHTTFQSIEDGENLAARALGQPEMAFKWDAIRAIVTRYDGTHQAEIASLMQAYLGKYLSPHRQDFTALIGQTSEQVQGIYEADYRDFNRETYARGRETFDASYAAFKRLLLGAWRRDEIALRDAEKAVSNPNAFTEAK
jgi:chromosome partitioning protein